MTAIILLSALAVVLVGVFGFIAYESSAARRDRNALGALTPEAASQNAAAAVVRARGQFRQAVEAYELALARNEQPAPNQQLVGVGDSAGTSAGGGAADPFVTAPGSLEPSVAALELQKEEARTHLLDAQRLWESVKPTTGPDADVDLWYGYGVLRGWHLGIVGYERGFLRVEHVLDSDCWAAYEVKRLRWGIAVGVENQRLAAYSAAVGVDRMPEIVGQAMGGAEVALRPGFSPQRWWRRRNRMPAPRRATSSLLQTPDLAAGADGPTRAAVTRAYEVEIGENPADLRSLGDLDGVMSVLAAGPTFMVGAWWGKDPTPVLLTSSPHSGWRND